MRYELTDYEWQIRLDPDYRNAILTTDVSNTNLISSPIALFGTLAEMADLGALCLLASKINNDVTLRLRTADQ